MKTTQQLTQEIEELKIKLSELQSEINQRSNFSLMYMNKRGKHNFVLQPKNQMENLIASGWKGCTKDDFLKIMDDYQIK